MRLILLTLTFALRFLAIPAIAQDKFDPSYLKIFPGRPTATLNGETYWVFRSSELGSYIGCYRWGCLKDEKSLVGKNVVVIGKYNRDVGADDNILRFYPETVVDQVLGVFTGSPPFFMRSSPSLRVDMVKQEAASDCGGWIVYCQTVIWGKVTYSINKPEIFLFLGSDGYYFVDLHGVNVFGSLGLLSAMLEGASIGARASIQFAIDAVKKSASPIH